MYQTGIPDSVQQLYQSTSQPAPFRRGYQVSCLKCREWDREAVAECDELGCELFAARFLADYNSQLDAGA